MCHCHDNLALRPEVAKKINIKNETGIHPDTLLDLREKATQKKSGPSRNFPLRISPGYRVQNQYCGTINSGATRMLPATDPV